MIRWSDKLLLIHNEAEDLPFKDASVDMVFCSPPYETARSYGIDWDLKGERWVQWMVRVVNEALRVCRGPCFFVIQGRTKDYRWSAVPALLMADLHRAGVCLRTPPIFHRVGIMGSGGKDWWRSDCEFIMCCTHGGPLPWSDNTANGHPPKYPPGGPPSHRTRDGRIPRESGARRPDGTRQKRVYKPPELANAGNLVHCHGGYGHYGHPLAHKNEAPFPEDLVDPFVRCFCPPGGIVLDPFIGSGTTAVVALRHGRRAIGVDLRDTQIELSAERISQQIEGVELEYI